MPRRGLPTAMSMRHDEHYVEALAASAGAPIGRMIPIDQVDPNPHQPRQVMGDLSELIACAATGSRSSPASDGTRRPSRQVSGSCPW